MRATGRSCIRKLFSLTERTVTVIPAAIGRRFGRFLHTYKPREPTAILVGHPLAVTGDQWPPQDHFIGGSALGRRPAGGVSYFAE